eukprot:g2563.t1
MRRLKLAALGSTNEEEEKETKVTTKNVRWRARKKKHAPALSMTQMNAEQRAIVHGEILAMRKEALRKQKMKRDQSRATLPQDYDENLFNCEETDEDGELKMDGLSRSSDFPSSVEREMESRAKYKLKLFGGNPSSCAEVKDRFDRVHSSIESLKDSMNPDRVELRQVKARMNLLDRTNSIDMPNSTVGAVSQKIPNVDDDISITQSREGADRDKNAERDRTLTTQNPSSGDNVASPSILSKKKKNSFMTETVAQDVNGAFMRGGTENVEEARGWIEKLRKRVLEQQAEIASLQNLANGESARAASFYRRCKQIERERDEWKDLYSREASQRLQTSAFEKERERLLRQISSLKSGMRELQSGSVSGGTTGSKVGSRRGSSYFLETKNFERALSRLRQAKQECDTYRELYECECQRNGTKSLSPNEVRTKSTSPRSFMSSVDSPLSFSARKRRVGRNLAEPTPIFPGVSS